MALRADSSEWILESLWMMPLASASDLSQFSKTPIAQGFGEWGPPQCTTMLTDLQNRGDVTCIGIGRTKRKQRRWFLTRLGVRRVQAIHHGPIDWQVTEQGLKFLIKRIQMVEQFYHLAPVLWYRSDVDKLRELYSNTNYADYYGPLEIPDSMALEKFTWLRSSRIHAVAGYTHGLEIPFVWAGLQSTLKALAVKWGERFHGLALGHGECDWELEYRVPLFWAIIAADRMAGEMVKQGFGKDAPKLVITCNGETLQSVREMDYPTCDIREPKTGPANLGIPERVPQWFEENEKMQALNGVLATRVFEAIEQWPCIRISHLAQAIRDSYRHIGNVTTTLERAGLVVRLEGGLYLTMAGLKLAAARDRVSYLTVRARFGALLNEDGVHRRRLARHNLRVIRISLKIQREGMGVAAGWRYVLNWPDRTQVDPDAVVMVSAAHGYEMHLLEYERSAKDPTRIQRKLIPYRTFYDEGIPLKMLLVCDFPEPERLFWSVGRGLPMVTTTFDEAVGAKVQFSGPDSIWRHFGTSVPITYLCDGHEEPDRP